MRLNSYLAKSTVVAALGGLLFGFDTAVISGTTAALSQHHQLTPELLGVTLASPIWGSLVGAMLAGYPGELHRVVRRLSRRGDLGLYSGSSSQCSASEGSSSLGSFSHWFMNGLISGVFPLMVSSSGAYPFVFFSGMRMLQFFVVLFIYPETKGVTLEAMQKKMGIA